MFLGCLTVYLHVVSLHAETPREVKEVSLFSPPANLPEASQVVTAAPKTLQDDTAPSVVSSASPNADHKMAAHTHTDSPADAPLNNVASTTMEDLMKKSMAGLCDRLEQMFNKRMQSLETTILRRYHNSHRYETDGNVQSVCMNGSQ